MGYVDSFDVQDAEFNKNVRNAWIVINILLISLVAFDLIRTIFRNYCFCCKAKSKPMASTDENQEAV